MQKKINMAADYKAILFDFDGTLADTMHDNFRAWKLAFKAHNVDLVPMDYFRLEGLKMQNVADELCSQYKVAKPWPPDLVSKKEAHYLANHTLKLYPGVCETIAYLKGKNFQLGIVTASSLARLQKTLDHAFLDAFDVVVTGDQSGRGKPYPDPFLSAATSLGLNQSNCLVVENAPLGIQAAKAAGMQCLAICSTLGAEYLQGADLVFDHFTQAQEFLYRL